LTGLELLQWLVRWGDKSRLLLAPAESPIIFHGHMAQLKPHLETIDRELSFTHHLVLPSGERHSLNQVKFFPAVLRLLWWEKLFIYCAARRRVNCSIPGRKNKRCLSAN